jgi:nickel-dependent lactate racemase
MSTSIPIDKRLGNLDCPIRDQINQAGKLAGLDFIINTIMDVNHRVVGIYSGDPIEAHRQGSIFSKEIYSISAEPTDIVIADSYPEETDFWTSSKAVLHAKGFVKKGGIMIICAACPVGLSKTTTKSRKGYDSPQELESKYLKIIENQTKYKDSQQTIVPIYGNKVVLHDITGSKGIQKRMRIFEYVLLSIIYKMHLTRH